MKELSTPFEIERHNDELRNHRLSEQRNSNDYDLNEFGEVEMCDDCGCSLNSHGHCPRCDY